MLNIFIFIATISVYLNLFKYYSFYSSLPNYIFYFLITLLVFIYYFSINKRIEFSKILFVWILYYFILNTIYYVTSGLGGLVEYKRYVSVILTTVVFMGYSLLYALDTKDLNITRKSILIAMGISVALLIYDFVFPGSFLLNNEDILSGYRALGIYNNQNIAGAVLIVGLILTIDIVPKAYRILYISYIFLGILVTFSRSNIIILMIIVFMMAVQNKISKITISFFYIFLFLFLLWLGFGGLEWIGNQFDITISSNLLNRLNFFVDQKDVDLSDISERKKVLKAAIEMFINHPLFGNGFASTSQGVWEFRVGPHNGFARTWAEFGMGGVFIIPLFLFCSTYQAFFIQKKYKDMGLLFVVYYILSSFFSHNLLDQEFNLVAAIIIATLGYKNNKLNSCRYT